MKTRTKWAPPKDIDPQCISICEAINALPGLATVESCCGHGKRPFYIYFVVRKINDLLPLLYWSDQCHSGVDGWRVVAYTDCSADMVRWVLEGPVGDYQGANEIARRIKDDL
jgi:hypothetical protein